VTRFGLVLGGCLGAALAALAAASPCAALAQEPVSRAAPAFPGGPVTLVMELPPGSALDGERLRAAIATELGVLVVRDDGAAGGTLRVRQEANAVTVSFVGPGGRRDARSIALEEDPRQSEQEIALVAGNVARDQASGFRAPSLPPPEAAATSAPAPPAATIARSACERVRSAARPRTMLGADFVPYAGTSSFDGGRSVRSLSIGALGAVSGGIDGVAVSGLVNADVGPVCGAEVGGLVDVSAGVEGVQASGIAAVANGDSAGLQLALVDVATGRVLGAQVGLVEVARQASVQIGLVNVASDADVQIGLVNIDLHGHLHLDAWTKPEAGTVLAGLKHGTPHMHTIYAFEMNVVSGRPWAVLGLGAHATPSSLVYVDIDALYHVELLPGTGAGNQLSELRAIVGYAPWRRSSFFAGPTFNVLVAPALARADAPGYASVLGAPGGTPVRAWPGVTLGLEGL
jgi:hypothetical protein